MCSVLEAPRESGLRVSRVSLHKHRETGADVEKNLLRQQFSAQYQNGNGIETKKCCAFVEIQGESSKTLGTQS